MNPGILYGIAACAGWGLAFIGPAMLAQWPGEAVAAGRYIAYGLWSLLALVLMRLRRGPLPVAAPHWRAALLLSLGGNLLYYVLLSVSIQRLGAYLPTLIIGLLPLTVSLAGRLRARQPLTPRYGLALVMIFVGLLLAHGPQPGRSLGDSGDPVGMACAFGALALWTVYGVANADWMRAHPAVGGTLWSSMQGLIVLPLSLALLATRNAHPESAQWAPFVLVSLVLGVVTSWLSNAAWNLASARLPTAMLGPLIVFETLFGLVYAAVWAQALPSLTLLLGAALLMSGVVLALREPRLQ